MAHGRKLRGRTIVFAALAISLACIAGARSRPQSEASRDVPSGFAATAWPQADRLFRSNPLWLGGDVAYSVDLGNGRVLWLFGDSFIATTPGQTRRQSTFVHNSIAIENGYDPASASISFYWPMKNGRPTEFAPNEGKVWLWPGDGIRIGSKLLLFFSRVQSDNSKNSLGFRSAGWTAFLVDNPDSNPSFWVLRRVKIAQNPWRISLEDGIVQLGDFVYAFGSPEQGSGDSLARWRVDDALRGDLSSPEWWCGKKGWRSQNAVRNAPSVVIADASSEFGVQWEPRWNKFIDVESVGFGASTIGIRWSTQIEGPWPAPRIIYRPPESDRPDAFVYAAKLHAVLTGADVVITYVANSSADGVLARDMSVYYPRFVRLNFSQHRRK